MDHKRYRALMERYNQIDALSIGPEDTKESVVKKLRDASYEKKQISLQANEIIRECVTKYEKQPELVDEDTVAMLEDFLDLLREPWPGSAMSDPLDPAISLRICRVLLGYYQANSEDPEQMVRILQECAQNDITLKSHQDDYESTPYAIMAEPFLGRLDTLSTKVIGNLVACLTLGGYNAKDPSFGLRKYAENRETFAYIRKLVGEDDFALRYYYALFKANALGFALSACYLMEAAQNRGAAREGRYIDFKKYAPQVEEFQQELKDILASEEARNLIYDRVSVKIYIAEADYRLGKITYDELMALLEEYSYPCEDYSAYERSSALLTAVPCYLDYLCVSKDHDRQYLQEKSTQIIEFVLTHAAEAVKDLPQYRGASTTNKAVLQMINTASGFLDFEFFKNTVLGATVFTNKQLYVHTLMVKEICLVLLEYILDHDPRYLDGVEGHDWEYCRDHKQELMDLMENCALLHDIGKYYCLDIISNASRSLTDDEFDIIKEHPTNFSKVYKGAMIPQMECIRDCAELHHLWYNEQGGYPRRAHTANKPFVNILTIADCIDAATDSVGRPYGLGKTLEQVTAEFDADRDTRYSGYISELLHVPEIQEKIEYIIHDRRRDIYCDIYLHHD